MPITFLFFLFQLNLITFNYDVLFFYYVYIFPTKAHPPCIVQKICFYQHESKITLNI